MSGSVTSLPPSAAEACIGKVISNSGPIITLAKIGRFDLLKDLFGQICIPQAVYDEVVVHGAGEPGARETSEAEWVKPCAIKDQLAVRLLREELHAGESEAIVLAQELGAAYVLLDDGLARRKAMRLGLHMIGTLGVLLLAKSMRLIPAVKPILDELRRTDFRMSARVYQDVLHKAGER